MGTTVMPPQRRERAWLRILQAAWSKGKSAAHGDHHAAGLPPPQPITVSVARIAGAVATWYARCPVPEGLYMSLILWRDLLADTRFLTKVRSRTFRSDASHRRPA